MANVLSSQKLLEAGSHFGHQTRRWNPKMKKYIYTAKKGVHIIDLSKTVKLMDIAYAFVKDTVAKGGSVIFVGTKKQAKEAIEEQAKRAGQFYMAERWLGGTLTNIKTVSKSIKRMIQIERMEKDGTFAQLPKKEVILLKKEHVKLEQTLKGIRNMMQLPKIMFVADPVLEQNAVKEAKKLGIKIVGIADTNCDPDQLDFVIPANDDANKSVALIASAIADACIEAKGGTPLVAFTKDEPRQIHEGGEERPRRDFNNGPRRDFNGPRREFNNDRPRRDFNNDRPRRDFNNDRPRRDFNNNRPAPTAHTAPVAAPVIAPVVTPVAAPATDYNAMTLADLKKVAKDKGLSGYSTLKKAEIVEMITKA